VSRYRFKVLTVSTVHIIRRNEQKKRTYFSFLLYRILKRTMDKHLLCFAKWRKQVPNRFCPFYSTTYKILSLSFASSFWDAGLQKIFMEKRSVIRVFQTFVISYVISSNGLYVPAFLWAPGLRGWWCSMFNVLCSHTGVYAHTRWVREICPFYQASDD